MMQFNCEWALYCFRASGLSGWWIRSIAQVQKLALTDRHVQNFALNNIKKTNYSTWRICLNTCTPFFPSSFFFFLFLNRPALYSPPTPPRLHNFTLEMWMAARLCCCESPLIWSTTAAHTWQEARRPLWVSAGASISKCGPYTLSV